MYGPLTLTRAYKVACLKSYLKCSHFSFVRGMDITFNITG